MLENADVDGGGGDLRRKKIWNEKAQGKSCIMENDTVEEAIKW